MRNLKAKCYAKGSEKTKSVTELLKIPVIHLNDLGWPNTLNQKKTHCSNHYVWQRGEHVRNHCVREKSIFYFNWLTNERGFDQNGGTIISEFNDLCLDNDNGITQCVKKMKPSSPVVSACSERSTLD